MLQMLRMIGILTFLNAVLETLTTGSYVWKRKLISLIYHNFDGDYDYSTPRKRVPCILPRLS